MKKILCLDFDGVICDSQQECLLVAYNAYNSFSKNSAKRINNINTIPYYIRRDFLKHRYLVRPAKEYWLIINLLVKNKEIPNQTTFDNWVNYYSKKLIQYEPFFFEERQSLKENSPELWFSLHRIYPEFFNYWESLNKLYEIYIVTNKDYSAVSVLLDYFGINISERKIWGFEKKLEKIDMLKNIMDLNDISNSDLIFVDDHPDYVESIINIGVKSYLAGWGYNKENKKNSNLVSDLGFLIKQ